MQARFCASLAMFPDFLGEDHCEANLRVTHSPLCPRWDTLGVAQVEPCGSGPMCASFLDRLVTNPKIQRTSVTGHLSPTASPATTEASGASQGKPGLFLDTWF